MLSHVDPQACIAGRRDEYKAPPNEATYVCLGKRSNDLGDVFTHAIYVLGMSLSFFLWKCSSQYLGVLLPFFMEMFIIIFFWCSLKGISPMDRERNLFPAVSPVQPPNGRLATSWDVTFIFYESVHHYISFGRLAVCDPLQLCCLSIRWQ